MINYDIMTQIIKELPTTDSEQEDSDVDAESNSDEEEFEEDLNIPSLVNHFFTNDEGENIAEILTQMKKSIDTHNKLIFKLISSAAENKKK